MSRKRWRDISGKYRNDPEHAPLIEEHKRAIRDALALAELRDRRGLTQTDLAGSLAMAWSRVSRIERQENTYLSTLREYVSALGGELEVRAVFPDEAVMLVGAKE